MSLGKAAEGATASLEGLLEAQRAAWLNGERPRVEELLRRLESGPETAPGVTPDALLDLVYHEVLLRERAGEAPHVDEYVARFPALEAELRRSFEVHAAMAGAHLDDGDDNSVVNADDAHAQAGAPSVPGFEVLGRLGQGGMGVVWEARQQSLGRVVALKLLPGGATADPDAYLRFQREARTASGLNDPHICTIYDLGEHAGAPFIVMERVFGRTLTAFARARPSAEATRPIVRQIAQALAAAHAGGIVHRDLKPDNVMLRDDGLVKVLDFGLARLTDHARASEARATVPGMVVGTLRYMSPEQLRGDPVEAPSDVYSLGVVWFELLTGLHPAGASDALASHGVRLPPRHEALLARMLAADARARPSMAEVALELGDSAPQAVETIAPPPAEARAAPRRSRLRLAIAALAIAVALALALLLSSISPREETARAEPATIAVMPFANHGAPSQAYLASGVTEDLSAMLARAPDLRVLAPGAAAAYAGSARDVREIGKELDVQYLVEGSVQESGGRLRIVAQLVETQTGMGVWSERFDQTGSDAWALQDEVAGRIVAALAGELGQVKRAEYRAAWGRDSADLAEYDYYLRGHELYVRFTRADNERAGAIWRDGLERFPSSTLLRAKLAWYHWQRPYAFFCDDPERDYAEAESLARGVLAAPSLSPLARRLALWLMAYVESRRGDYDAALRDAEVADRLAPYDAFAHGDLATPHIFAGKVDDALARIRDASAADPSNAPFYRQLEGWALSVGARWSESAEALKTALELPATRVLQAVADVQLGRLESAREHIRKALSLAPDLTRTKWRAANFYREASVLRLQLDALATAGLPE